MQITSIKFNEPKNKEGAVKQFLSICLDDCLIIRGLRIVETQSGELFVSFPNRKLPNGNRFFSSFPIKDEFRIYVQARVLEEYKTICA